MKYYCALSLALLALNAGTLLADAPTARRPNVVLFLVDDMGWMDSGVYGSKYYDTPNIDRFARRAMLFTDAYAQPLCSPTRGSLLTGKYSARHGITTASGHQPPQPAGHSFLPASAPANQLMLLPESKNYLEPTEYTVAEALRDAGYRTAHIGKWHLGLTAPHWPEQQGFDTTFHCHPDPGPPGNYFSPYKVVPAGAPRGRDNRVGNITDGPPGEYIVDRLTDEAIKFIEANRDRPFLLHLWQYGVHGPWGHKESYTRQFAEKKDPRDQQGNPIMASMLKSVDESFGRLLASLDQLGLTENTIVIFNSDNGGNTHSNTVEDATTKKRKANDSLLADWRKWAGNKPPTNNAPLRDGKGTLYEGGTRVPLMWSWPGHIAAGSQSSAVVGHIDYYPTLLELLSLPRPTQQVFDGISYARVLTAGDTKFARSFFNYHPHAGVGRAGGVWVRSGDWKLLRWFAFPVGDDRRWELYNLRDDLSESQNLAGQMPEKVAELDKQIDQFLSDTGALYPRPNPAFPAGAAVKGWSAGKDAQLTSSADSIQIESATGRPTLQIARLTGAGTGDFFTVRFRLRTRDGRGALVLWGTAGKPSFSAERRMPFEPQRDGEWHDYAVKIAPDEELVALRIDASLQPATVEFAWIRLERADGTTVAEWSF